LGSIASCTIPGSQVIHAQITSPLTIIVLVVVIAITPLALYLGRRRRGLPTKAVIALTLAVIVPVAGIIIALPYTTAKPDLDYGAWLEGHMLEVRFYSSKVVEFNLCNTNVSLIDRSELGHLLKYRSFGVGDPLAGIDLGYFKTRDGRTAYVVVVGKDVGKLLVADDGSKVAVIGVKCPSGVSSLYKAIMEAKADCRGTR